MMRFLILFAFINLFLIDIHSQPDIETRHVYGLISDYYYLNILPGQKYSLKVGMYLDKYVKGDYTIIGDTLVLSSFDFFPGKYDLSKNDKLIVTNGLSKFQINDSLLIPIAYKDFLPSKSRVSNDSLIFNEYIQNDGHVNYKITLYSDSSFVYRTGSDKDRHRFKGMWFLNDDLLVFKPFDDNNLLHWICTDNKMIMIENFLVGSTFDEQNELKEYHYMIGVKPAANNVYSK